MNRKMMSLFAVGLFIVAMLGVLGTTAAKNNSLLRNPSIQQSDYYRFVFTVDYAGRGPVYLIFDGERKEMQQTKVGSDTYIARVAFSSGDHQYAFICGSACLPNQGMYKISNTENHWILLNSVIKHFLWKMEEEQQLRTKLEVEDISVTDLERLYNLETNRIRALAMAQGTLCYLQDSPQNFDKNKLLEQLITACLEYSWLPDVPKQYSSLGKFFQQSGELYMDDAIMTYSKLASAKKIYKDPKQELQTLERAIEELRSAKNTMQWTAIADASENIISSTEQLACIDDQFLSALNLGIRHLYVGIAAFYGDEEFGKQWIKENTKTKFEANISKEEFKIDLPQKENTSGCSVCKPSLKTSRMEKNKGSVVKINKNKLFLYRIHNKKRTKTGLWQYIPSRHRCLLGET